MKRPNKSGKRVVPQPGGEAFHEGEPAPLSYNLQMPPVKSRGRLIPRPDWLVVDTDSGQLPTEDCTSRERARIQYEGRPLVPASEEVAQLPRTARDAYAARCAARVVRLRPNAATPEAATALILAAATVAMPIRRQLLCLRRDFDRIVSLVKEHNWTDDTPVLPEVFGPMWPKGLTPDWAQEPPVPHTPSE